MKFSTLKLIFLTACKILQHFNRLNDTLNNFYEFLNKFLWNFQYSTVDWHII